MKQYFYPVRDADNPSRVHLEPINEEVYRSVYPEIWRTQKWMRRHGRCACPRRRLWACDADCAVCPYSKELDDELSLDAPIDRDEDIALADTMLFLCFVMLVFLDCLTRWVAISYKYLREQGEEHPSLLRSIWRIPAARRAGRIESRVMKEQGLCKLLLYGVCVIVACLVDLMMATLHAPGWMVNLMVSYMAITETLSVVENLSDAGVDSLARLVEKLKGRL